LGLASNLGTQLTDLDSDNHGAAGFHCSHCQAQAYSRHPVSLNIKNSRSTYLTIGYLRENWPSHPAFLFLVGLLWL
jgi:hypothetical protein